MPETTIRISRERKELLAKYATAACFLYGVISVEEFAEVFNHYEPDLATTAEEAPLALERHSKATPNTTEYSIKDGIITEPFSSPGIDEYYEINVKAIRKAQKGKPRYLPDKEEYLKYQKFSYREPSKQYDALKAYIIKHKLTDNGEGAVGIEGDLLTLFQNIQLNAPPQKLIEQFTDSGYKFKDINAINEFIGLLMDVCNNTRRYDNNDFTPNEIFEKFERPKLRPLPKEPFVFPTAPIPSKNGAYSCGSGKKYKRCCGK